MLQRFKTFIFSLVAERRKKYCMKRLRMLNNKDITIISNNCVAGIIYHDLGLQFKTPTINLRIPFDDFLTFAEDLYGFLSEEVEEVKNSDETFPVGKICHDGKTVILEFMHFSSFEEAKDRWDARKKRVDPSNICIMFVYPLSPSEEYTGRFDSLPFEKKVLIAKDNPYNSKSVFVNSVFSRKDYQGGDILLYKTKFSKKRYLDEFDYVSFFNS